MRGWVSLGLLLALLVGFGVLAPAEAQVIGADPEPSAIETLVEQAREDGYRVILVPSEEAGTTQRAAAAVDIISITAVIEARAQAARNRLVEILSGLDRFPAHLMTVVERHAKTSGVYWPALALGLVAAFLTIGWVVEGVIARWLQGYFSYVFSPTPADRAEKISYLLLRAVMRGLTVISQLTVAGLLTIGFGPDTPAWRSTMVLTILAVGLARLLSVIVEALLAPDVASHRLIRFNDRDAQGLYNGFRVAIWIAALVGASCILMDMLGLDRDAHLLMLISAALLTVVLFSVLAVHYRAAVAAAILGPGDEMSRSVAMRLFARTWHVFAVTYLLGAGSVTTVRLLLDLQGALGLVMVPLLAGVLGLAAYAVALLVIDRWFARRGTIVSASDGVSSTSQGFKGLAEHAAGLLVVAGIAWSSADPWIAGSDHASDSTSGVLEVLLVVFIAYLCFRGVKILIDTKIAEEGGAEEAAELGDEGGAAGASRLATLLPIFRNFLLVVIAVIAGMIVLSELGVDIAPLFAGAGVIGLAVGFGAQTLIRDIFSGAFFLVDDAFRRGEYIDLGTVRGTVEKISVRSMQLRHHLGPLHTIPFGEIQYLTNYSRDWVMMKLPLRVTYDTDVEKVRKLIKTLGQELLEDPTVGDKFLEPLKSQGVYQMEDSAMIIRVKFMTKPGDQFGVRKVVYAKIRELFAQHGIHFAHKEVTVRLAEQPADRPLTEEEKDAVVGAVRPVIDAEMGEAAPTNDGR